MQNIRNIRIAWQAATVICALLIVPAAGIVFVSTMIGEEQRSAATGRMVSGAAFVIALLMAFGAVRSSLKKRSKEQAAVAARQLGHGILVMAAATVLTVGGYFFAGAIGPPVFFIFTGMYIFGMVMIARAMGADEQSDNECHESLSANGSKAGPSDRWPGVRLS